METRAIDQVLAQLRSTAAAAAGKAEPAGGTDFGQALKAAIDQVNQAQQEGAKLAEKFAGGDTDTNLHEVMLSLQKANVSFQEMIQVRNRLVSAYQDIMNMQI
jgi:flagellar hook-basal body complex protein FliE